MTWNADSMRSLGQDLRSHRGDFTDIEVKRGTTGVPDLTATLRAFGNMPNGGTIVVGLDEARHFEPVGVPDPAATSQAIASQARSAVVPPVAVTLEVVHIDEQSIVVATVAGVPASERPCRTAGRAYLRGKRTATIPSAPPKSSRCSLCAIGHVRRRARGRHHGR